MSNIVDELQNKFYFFRFLSRRYFQTNIRGMDVLGCCPDESFIAVAVLEAFWCREPSHRHGRMFRFIVDHSSADLSSSLTCA